MNAPTLAVSLAEHWGNRIADRRRELGISQLALANDCQVTQQTISSIERGKSIPTDVLKIAIAYHLLIPTGELFVWPEEWI